MFDNSQKTNDQDDVTIEINGVEFIGWSAFKLTRSLDAMDTLTLTAVKDNNQNIVPLSFLPVTVRIGGKFLFSGTLISVDPLLSDSTNQFTVSCYSMPAILNDCSLPADKCLEWENANITTIANDICAFFGIKVVVNCDVGAVFERVSIDINQKPIEFLYHLAMQRGVLLGSTEKGELLITKEIEAGNQVAIMSQGNIPLSEVLPMTNPQNFYSEVTAIAPVNIGNDGYQVTIQNPYLNVYRPYSFEATDTLSADLEAACMSKLGRMFANAISYNLLLSTWRDSSGNLFKPNATILLYAPDAFINSEQEFLIRSVSFSRGNGNKSAVLNVVLLGALSGKIPSRLPWH